MPSGAQALGWHTCVDDVRLYVHEGPCPVFHSASWLPWALGPPQLLSQENSILETVFLLPPHGAS